MPEETKREYTLNDIASIAGVARGGLWAAMNAIKTDKKPLPPSAQKIANTLLDLGITWRDIKHVRGKKAAVPAPKVAQPEAKTPESATLGALCAPDTPEAAPRPCVNRSLAHEKAIMELFAEDWEPDDEPAPAPSFVPSAPNYLGDFRLSHIPLEVLVLEITRRMPRAEITLR